MEVKDSCTLSSSYTEERYKVMTSPPTTHYQYTADGNPTGINSEAKPETCTASNKNYSYHIYTDSCKQESFEVMSDSDAVRSYGNSEHTDFFPRNNRHNELPPLQLSRMCDQRESFNSQTYSNSNTHADSSSHSGFYPSREPQFNKSFITLCPTSSSKEMNVSTPTTHHIATLAPVEGDLVGFNNTNDNRGASLAPLSVPRAHHQTQVVYQRPQLSNQSPTMHPPNDLHHSDHLQSRSDSCSRLTYLENKSYTHTSFTPIAEQNSRSCGEVPAIQRVAKSCGVQSSSDQDQPQDLSVKTRTGTL